MNPELKIVFEIIQLIFLASLGLPVLYIFIFAVAGLFYRKGEPVTSPLFCKIAVLIPCYKEDLVIREVAADALLQDYPKELYEVVIIADSLQQATIEDLSRLPVRVIEVSFEKSTKSLALNKAMEILPGSFDLAVVLDADNLMAPGFLSKINAAFGPETYAVQGHRKAKNMDTPLAILDAISEEINNHIFRKGHRVLGFSSAIIGSGMAFRYSYFRNLMAGVRAVGGFDKDIELRMLSEGKKIFYLSDAEVLDEKVQTARVFTDQRRRWLSSQLIYFRRDFFPSLKALLMRGNIDYFEKIIQFIQPPRVLLLGASLFFGAIFLLLDLLIRDVFFLPSAWSLVLLLCVLAFLFSVPRYLYSTASLKALLNLPRGMLLMLGSLLRIHGANNQFIHTRHSATKESKAGETKSVEE